MPWQRNDRVWCRFYSADDDRYVPGIDGFIDRVLPDGRAEYVNRQGEREQTTNGIHFHTCEACEAEIAKHPRPGIPTINERVSKE